MEQIAIWLLTALAAFAGPLLTLFDLPGNTLLLLTGAGLIFFRGNAEEELPLLAAMLAVYACGECWEFFISLFGVRRFEGRRPSWLGVLFIGVGGFWGTLLGTGVLPVLGSFLGGLAGAFAAAFAYEYLRGGTGGDAWRLALLAAKTRCLALAGKLAAALALAVMLARLIFWE